MASNSILRAKTNPLRPSDSAAPMYVDANDGNKIKILRGGVGDTEPVTILTSGEDGAEGKIGYGPGDGGSVIQASSISNAVTLNTLTGEVNTQPATTAALGVDQFFVNNTNVGENDIIALTWGYGGPGAPHVSATILLSGQFLVQIRNYHPTDALNGAFVIRFAIIGGSDN